MASLARAWHFSMQDCNPEREKLQMRDNNLSNPNRKENARLKKASGLSMEPMMSSMATSSTLSPNESLGVRLSPLRFPRLSSCTRLPEDSPSPTLSRRAKLSIAIGIAGAGLTPRSDIVALLLLSTGAPIVRLRSSMTTPASVGHPMLEGRVGRNASRRPELALWRREASMAGLWGPRGSSRPRE
jgi:hypothetical protein